MCIAKQSVSHKILTHVTYTYIYQDLWVASEFTQTWDAACIAGESWDCPNLWRLYPHSVIRNLALKSANCGRCRESNIQKLIRKTRIKKWLRPIPSGKRSQKTMENHHHAINGKIHDKSMVNFNVAIVCECHYQMDVKHPIQNKVWNHRWLDP